MVITLSASPAIDYVISIDSFAEGGINRTKTESIYAGGKGINVSIVLKYLGLDNIALGFVAGSTGNMLEEMIAEQGIRSDFVHVAKGFTGINIKICSEIETEINGQGPIVNAGDILKLYNRLDVLSKGDYLVMSGNTPNCLKGDAYKAIVRELKSFGYSLRGTSFYSDICELMSSKGVKIVVDATEELLLDTIKHRPFLVKPNHYELGEMFGVSIESYDDTIAYARKLYKMGAFNVMVSMASKGAILVDEHGDVHVCNAPTGRVINSVGAGDATVAAFLARYIEQTSGSSDSVDYSEILRYAVAAGSATAFKSGLATREDIEQFL